MKFGWIIAAVIALVAIVLITTKDGGTFDGLPDGAIAQIIYLSCFALLIGFGIIPRRGEVKAFFRNIALWLAIIFTLLAGYVYRYELQDIGSRVTGGLIAGSPVTTQNSAGQTQVTVFKTDNRHFVARGSVNGEPINFLVDTGASSIVLSAEDAKRAGFDLDQLAFTIPVSTANGVTTSARSRVNMLRIGDIVRSQVPVMIAKPGNLSESLLGMTFIDSLWGFEIRGDRMIFTDQR